MQTEMYLALHLQQQRELDESLRRRVTARERGTTTAPHPVAARRAGAPATRLLSALAVVTRLRVASAGARPLGASAVAARLRGAPAVVARLRSRSQVAVTPACATECGSPA